jgi:hypothetical protein
VINARMPFYVPHILLLFPFFLSTAINERKAVKEGLFVKEKIGS